MYFDYPLEQGLRRNLLFEDCIYSLYFDYPLEQGLRQEYLLHKLYPRPQYFDYPLEQGLRQV